MPLPSIPPLSRFGLIYLAVAVGLVFAMLWFLNHLPAPDHKPVRKPAPSPTVAPAKTG